MQKFISYIKEKLDLTVKPNWEVFPIDYIDSHKKRHGRPIDIMGYVIYRDHTVIRTCIFLSIRRSYLRAARRYINVKPRRRIPVEAAHRCVSYFGWLKNSSLGTFIFPWLNGRFLNLIETKINVLKSEVHKYAFY